MAEEPVLPDQAPGCPHPREVFGLIGHAEAEQLLARALGGHRLHHAWIIAGPRGVGKASLAYRFARRALGARSASAADLATDPQDPVCRKILQGAHPDLRVATRFNPETGKAGAAISVDTIRALTGFFELSADGQGGRRVAIIDAADEMNQNAANALLKTLEEPPPGALLLLVTHAPGRLLATIRSRCRRIDLGPVDEAALRAGTGISDPAILAMAHGAPGRAIALQQAGAGRLYRELSGWLSLLPKAPQAAALNLATLAGSAGAFPLFADLTADWLARAGRAATGLPIAEVEPGESLIMARLAAAADPAALARAWSALQALRGQVESVNLDPGAGVLQALSLVRAGLAPRAAA